MLSVALQKTQMACGIITDLALVPDPANDLQWALERMVAALSGITEALKPAPPKLRVVKANPKLRVVKAKKVNGHVLKISATERALDLLESEWDPPSTVSRIESSRCRALLLEIIKRAIHDWVLYKSHSELTKATYAREAYVWLFEEEEDHPDFAERKKHGTTITSFIVICEVTDLRPEELRSHIKRLKVSDVMGTGRPAERRRLPSEEVCIEQHSLAGVSIESFEAPTNYRHTTYLEQHYAPNQLSYI